jgi:hypothetical protein
LNFSRRWVNISLSYWDQHHHYQITCNRSSRVKYKRNKMTVERQTNVWIGKRRIIYFASRTQRLEKEVNFSSSCSADYQHWTYLSLYMYCPIVNYYTKWTEHKANLILLFRVFSSLSLSLFSYLFSHITTLTTERVTIR